MATTGYENLISGSSSSTTTTASTTTSTSSSSLSNDDFLTLLVTELQYQDPTDPMDTETILTQTSQLASIEAAENTADSLDALSSQLQSSTTFNAVSSIGKMASLGSNYIPYEGSGDISFEVYFPNEISDGTLTIADSSGNVVRTIDLGDEVKGESGIVTFTWDGLDDEGNQVDEGDYSVGATYVDPDGASDTTVLGVYPIESVYYDDGVIKLKLGSNYYEIDEVVEIYERTGA
ncbi:MULTISPECIES: flagellar hook capping FlgD N-terminal domain-containing protein [unclassified Sulfurospirillum]|uniref:flagellar hook capping FlgD N-terminal domain-containing protein n=1 Tax=unclassified Sulfurospirillum TaxID=2618290 RepID=UPI000502AB85|nr:MULTISPECIES: flagellar hook capping FlgD N-terminal domain-containing protein [unclassified Sulfurospirillum]KFL33761.1 flagellar hook capping protein [Sulfurospirillum sp. SCADC]